MVTTTTHPPQQSPPAPAFDFGRFPSELGDRVAAWLPPAAVHAVLPCVSRDVRAAFATGRPFHEAATGVDATASSTTLPGGGPVIAFLDLRMEALLRAEPRFRLLQAFAVRRRWIPSGNESSERMEAIGPAAVFRVGVVVTGGWPVGSSMETIVSGIEKDFLERYGRVLILIPRFVDAGMRGVFWRIAEVN
ncbi:hypothetical protein HK405_010460 [Cladochytrium tenue]|nr:hypothetical protein HK405_010460 [Cladochytrium tenue]